MDLRLFHWLSLFLALPGLSHGLNVLPAGPLSASVAGAVTFTTTIDPPAQPFDSVKWLFNGSNIITSISSANNTGPGYGDRITLYRSTGSLELKDLTISDSGVYALEVVTADANTLRGETTLNVYLPESSLSAGAIAGITIAVILLVGGIVGGVVYIMYQKGLMNKNNTGDQSRHYVSAPACDPLPQSDLADEAREV